MKKFFISIVVLIALVVVAWQVNFPSYSFRYKITVEVETPEGIKSGYAVREVTVSRQPKIGDAPSVIFDVRGEAVAVDFGQRGVVFALINWDSDRDVYYALNTMDKDRLKAGLKGELPPTRYPQFVMFKDMADPKSVTLVRGGHFNKKTQDFDPVDDFETIFGAGVKLKQIVIEITDEPVTWGIVDKYLPNIFHNGFKEWWNTLDLKQKTKLSNLYNFTQGVK